MHLSLLNVHLQVTVTNLSRWVLEIKVKDRCAPSKALEVGGYELRKGPRAAPLACMCCDVVVKLYSCEVEMKKIEAEGVV